MTGPLDGIRVLDVSSGLAGAVATMVLCDNGAEVIKLEPPGGDPQRSLPAFAQWHRGKQSAVADLRTDDGRRRAQELAAEADVLVQAWRPGVAERLGLGYDGLSGSNPGLVYCSISGFGPGGPYAGIKGYEAIVGAKAGTMAGEDRPRFAALPGASFGAAQGALQGILAALLVRASTGRGQKVETSLVQGLTAYELYNWLGPQLHGEQASKPRAGFTFSSVSGMVAFTKDGRWLQFANFRPHLVDAFLAAVGLTEYYAEAMARKEPAQVINDTVLRRLHEKTLDEWMEIFLRSDDIGVEPFRTPAEALDHPQMLHNGHVLELTDPSLGKTRQVGPLVRMTKTPSSPREGAPVLGGWSLGDASFTSPRTTEPVPAAPAAPSPGAGGPLSGVTVLELAWFYAAPFGTALLADLGARVIKVEGATGDPHRYQNPLPEFAGVKALGGKQSIVVDYRTPEGREILHRLVARADIVMRNYRQQNSAAVGDDYASLEAANPSQVYLYAAAYGSDGPYTTRPAFAPTMSVAAGHRGYQLGWERALDHRQSITFDEGQKQLAAINLRSGGPTNNADAASALVVGTGMLLGLLARQRTGQGQYLETTMMCSNAYVVSDEFFDYDGKATTAHHDENGTGPLYRLYPTQAGWVFLAAPRDADWDQLRHALTTVTGTDVLGADPRFTTAAGRATHGPELAAALAAVFSSRPAADWEARLVPHDVACVEVSQGPFSEFTINDPTMVDNGFVAEVEHPLFGRHRRHGPIVTMTSTPGKPGPGCLVGQHTRLILGELGYTNDQMAELRDRHIVAWPESPAG
jgi:crotonobetainyl-CoA:carnitine CoA-transferase CaiB-like acyl-CoA transferase